MKKEKYCVTFIKPLAKVDPEEERYVERRQRMRNIILSDSFGSEKGTIFSCVCGGTTRKPVLFESQSTYTDDKLQTHLWLGWDYGHCVSNS